MGCRLGKPDITFEDGPPKSNSSNFLDLTKMAEIQTGKSSEDDIYKVFGEGLDLRLTYDPILPKKHLGHYYPVDKFLLYFGGKGTTIENPGFREHITMENLSVSFFLYKDKLQFYSIKNRQRGKGKLAGPSTPDIIEFAEIEKGAHWPYQECDRYYYEAIVLKLPQKDRISYLPDKELNGYDCDFAIPNLEEDLKADGYYDRL